MLWLRGHVRLYWSHIPHDSSVPRSWAEYIHICKCLRMWCHPFTILPFASQSNTKFCDQKLTEPESGWVYSVWQIFGNFLVRRVIFHISLSIFLNVRIRHPTQRTHERAVKLESQRLSACSNEISDEVNTQHVHAHSER